MNRIALIFIISSIYFLYSGCTSPLDIGGDTDKSIINDNSGVADLRVAPDTLDFGVLLLKKNQSKEFQITNISGRIIEINNFESEIKTDLLMNPAVFQLTAKDTEFASKNIELNFTASKVGNIFEYLTFNKFNAPRLYIKATVPGFYVEDTNFENTAVNSISGLLLTARNVSDESITIISSTFSPTIESISYSIEPEFPIVLAPDTSYNFFLKFRPLSEGWYQTEITFDVQTSLPYLNKAILKGFAY
jgi:hypothetical protein